MIFKKKQYFHDMFEDNIKNSKGTWNIINNLIIKKKKKNNIEYISSSKESNFEIAKKCNITLGNIGKKLANLIERPDNINIYDTLCERNNYSLFITPITSVELFNIISNCNSKYSADIFNMNMIFFKYILNAKFVLYYPRFLTEA